MSAHISMTQVKCDPLVELLLDAKNQAARRQLWTTMRRIDDAIQRLGWELAGHRTESKYERMRRMM